MAWHAQYLYGKLNDSDMLVMLEVKRGRKQFKEPQVTKMTN